MQKDREESSWLAKFVNWIYILENKPSLVVKILIQFIIAFVLPFICSLVWAFSVSGFKYHDFNNAIKSFWGNFFPWLLGLHVFVLELMCIQFSKLNKIKDVISESLFSYNKQIEKGVREQFDRVKIVFETPIKDYDDFHLLAMKDILNCLSAEVRQIYAIDYSDPMQWWSETMTGYVGLLSNWRCNGHGKKVDRIFIYERSELLNPVIAKTLTLHSLNGFGTHVFTKDRYDALYADFKLNNPSSAIEKREIFVWDNSTKYTASHELPDGSIFRDITFFQSFWNLDISKVIRRSYTEDIQHKWGLFGGHKSLTSEEILVWFEFISKNALLNSNAENIGSLPNDYFRFAGYLVHSSIPCQDDNDVRRNCTGSRSGIKIEYSNTKLLLGQLKAYSEI